MEIGPIIGSLRKLSGLTQEQIALEAGTNAAHISRIERGDRLPSLQMLEVIAKALGTSTAAICAAAEGLGDETTALETFESVFKADISDESIACRMEFRRLSKPNQRIAIELLRALRRTQDP